MYPIVPPTVIEARTARAMARRRRSATRPQPQRYALGWNAHARWAAWSRRPVTANGAITSHASRSARIHGSGSKRSRKSAASGSTWWSVPRTRTDEPAWCAGSTSSISNALCIDARSRMLPGRAPRSPPGAPARPRDPGVPRRAEGHLVAAAGHSPDRPGAEQAEALVVGHLPEPRLGHRVAVPRLAADLPENVPLPARVFSR